HHRQRALAAAVAAQLPVVANQLYPLGITPDRWIDLTPLGFALGGLVLTRSLLRDHFLELPPVARGRILDAIDSGVVVLDSHGRVRDLNPAAASLVGCGVGDVLGPPWFQPGAPSPGREVAAAGGRAFELSRTPTRHVPGGGTIVTVRDVT